MILEGVVTTLNPDGSPNIAPMGPRVGEGWEWFEFRPYRTSTTYSNLKREGEGVLHVTDDVLLIARAAIGLLVEPKLRRAERVRGVIVEDACRYYEFRVERLDDREERTSIIARTVASGRIRDFFGLNRAKHAVIEAAILATRIQFLPIAEIQAQLRALGPLVEKTGGADDHAAFTILSEHVSRIAAQRAASLGPSP